MKRVRRCLSFVLAFILVATGIQVTGLTVNAKTEWKETNITSIKYDVTVSECEGEDAFEWKAQTASWQEKSQTVELNGEGDYSFALDLGSKAGMKNLGFVELISDSAMKIEVRKITVNDTYMLSFGSNPVLQAGVKDCNGLANIWNTSVGTKICQSDDAYLALNQADGAIALYVAEEVEESSSEEKSEVEKSETAESSSEAESSMVEESSEEYSEEETTNEEESSEEVTSEEESTEEESSEEVTTEEQTSEESVMEIESITSVKYEVTVDGSNDLASFTWKAQAASWQEKAQIIELDGDGYYSFELAFDYEKGVKNLGFIEVISGSEMTVTVNKITVNDTYELAYETAPVLQAGVNNANGLANIWNVQPQVRICGDDSAYLALDQQDGAIQLYVAQEEESKEEESTGDSVEVEPQTLTSLTYCMTVAQAGDLEAFSWKAQAASWNVKEQTVALDGDGEYEVSFQLDYEEGMKNLGYIEPVDGSSMTATITKIVVNDTYELTYETAPVLKAGENGANGLANIWNVQPEVKICGDENAYFALDKQDGAITFYAGKVTADEEEGKMDSDASIKYVEAMGSGWNLGNSFEGFDSDLSAPDRGELAWGNPTVTRELIAAVKDKGYDSIRIPFTVYRRYTVNEAASADEYKYVINEDWLKRYKEVINWALDEDLYVMINIHHDSWIWLKYWDGDKSSEEYRMYTDFWKQLAEYMADLPQQVCFETINEPDFVENAQQKLDEINQAAYDIIRGTKGNEERMIVLPTVYTNFEKGASLYNFIKKLDDHNVIATVHYYSEWVYSANLGKTGFDEELWQNNGESYTARDAADNMMKTIKNQFVSKGIGVIIGEYGLLGYDASEGCLETGEELKYYEYMNELARQNNVCLIFWDNGSGINRKNGSYTWKKPTVGEMLENSMTGRSSYATGADNLYFKEEVKSDVAIALTLNGNTFKGIEGLTEGTDYTYDSNSATVTLKKEYINKEFAKMSGYGTFAELVMKFSSGADWHEYLIKYADPVVGKAQGSKDGIQIPVEFNGSRVRRVTAYQASGKVGPNSDWWDYLQYDSSFGVDYEKGTINLLSAFFADATVKDGLMKLKAEFYDGQIIYIWLTVDGNQVTSSPDMEVNAEAIDASTTICLYTGETAVPVQYLDMPEGGSVYGTWVDEATNNGMVTLEGWPCKMIFDTKAHEDFVSGGIVLYYMDLQKYIDVSFGIKDAPMVEDIDIKAGNNKKLTVSNLAEDAKVTYKSSNISVATVSTDGTVTGKKAGEAVITVTVEQYNRSDDFEATVKVTGTASQGQSSSSSGNSSNSGSQSSGSSQTSSTKQETAKQETKTQKIIEQQVALAPQPVIVPETPVQQPETVAPVQSQSTQKSTSTKTETVETEESVIEGTAVEVVTESVVEEMSEVETQEIEASTETEVEKATTVEEEATPLAAEQLQEKTSPLPFVIAGIMVVIFAMGVVVIYLRRKEDIME
ncbi:MAG: cellulase family glycosylhydrolase [Lachnospiraceae bacterium]|nr:cellulase family glycosylhydrolase [Lachnospiraceae bacterium]